MNTSRSCVRSWLRRFNSDEVVRTRCPACGASAPRDYATHTFASPSIGTTGELAEDPDS